MKRIGMLTSGGDCQALNAAMRGVAKAMLNANEKVEIYGFQDGYQGLIYGRFRLLTYADFTGILTKGGTFLGTSRTPFKTIQVPGEDGVDKVSAMKQTYYKLQLDCLVILGGNGTHKTANLLRQEGLNVVTLPKTIDNDLWGTDMTFGFQSAVNVATEAIDCIHTTAASHGRIFVVEVMGHKVGWLTLNAGIAGGADIILIPEIPYDADKLAKKIKERQPLHHPGGGRGGHFQEGRRAEQEGVQEEAGQADPSLRILRDRRGAGQALRSGGPGDGAGPHAEGRQPLPLRPGLRLPPGQRGREADPQERVRLHGGL